MTIINVGVQFQDERYPTGWLPYPEWVRTKRALKELAKYEPETLRFLHTAPYRPEGLPRAFTVDEWNAQGPEVILKVVGPNPWLSRKWTATVTTSPKGLKIK